MATFHSNSLLVLRIVDCFCQCPFYSLQMQLSISLMTAVHTDPTSPERKGCWQALDGSRSYFSALLRARPQASHPATQGTEGEVASPGEETTTVAGIRTGTGSDPGAMSPRINGVSSNRDGEKDILTAEKKTKSKENWQEAGCVQQEQHARSGWHAACSWDSVRELSGGQENRLTLQGTYRWVVKRWRSVLSVIREGNSDMWQLISCLVPCLQNSGKRET